MQGGSKKRFRGASDFSDDFHMRPWLQVVDCELRSGRRLGERKLKQVENAGKKSHKAKLIKLADKTSNLRTIAISPAADWSVKRRLGYIEWAKSVVIGVRGTSPWLEQQFDEAVAVAVRSLDPSMAGA
jgi:hypothetical protein